MVGSRRSSPGPGGFGRLFAELVEGPGLCHFRKQSDALVGSVAVSAGLLLLFASSRPGDNQSGDRRAQVSAEPFFVARVFATLFHLAPIFVGFKQIIDRHAQAGADLAAIAHERLDRRAEVLDLLDRFEPALRWMKCPRLLSRR
jgi:hypothetical protein